MKALVRPAGRPLEGTRFVCRPEGNGFVVLNRHRKWTPVLEFGHAFEANFAVHLARWRSGFTRESLTQDVRRGYSG